MNIELNRVRSLAFTVLIFLVISRCCAEDAQNAALLTVDRIYKSNEFGGQSFGVRWMPDGDSYASFEKAAEGEGQDLIRYEVESGNREILIPAAEFIPSGSDKPIGVQHYEWSADMSKLLIFANSQRVWRQNTRGDYWVLDRQTKKLTRLGGEDQSPTLMFAKFSPDGKSVAYVRNNDIFVETIDADKQEAGGIKAITQRASGTMINGTFDWVYEEEFGLRDGYRWSPDGKRIAFWQIDTEGVPQFTLVDNTSKLYPETKTFCYPKVGQLNPAARIGVVELESGQTRILQLPGDLRNNYIAKMDWAGNSQELVLQQLNRLQNELKIFLAEVQTGEVKIVFTDRDEAWIDVDDDFHWIDDGQEFVWSSECDGWNRLYTVSRSGERISPLTIGDFDVMQFLEVEPNGKTAYFLASPDKPTERYLYRVSENNNEPIRVTPADQTGTHSYQISPNLHWAVHTYSRFDTPPITEMIRLPEHQTVRVHADNKELRAKLAKLNLGKTRFLRVDIGEGVELDGWEIRPPDFDPAKKYPLLVYVYGEPAGQTVLDRWSGSGYLWHQMLAQHGYIVMSFDNRGTPAARGRAWRKSVYRQIGVLAAKDQAAAVQCVTQQDNYIDASRVGIWGWSGGGSMSLNAILQYPDLYKMAIAIAPVPNQLYYDTIYQERYMGLPADNPEGYKQGSPITYAEQLKGNLLLVHGTGDDNCHYQTMELLIDELIRHNKPFSMMAYPNRSHSISEGQNTTVHLRQLMTRYVLSNL